MLRALHGRATKETVRLCWNGQTLQAKYPDVHTNQHAASQKNSKDRRALRFAPLRVTRIDHYFVYKRSAPIRMGSHQLHKFNRGLQQKLHKIDSFLELHVYILL